MNPSVGEFAVHYARLPCELEALHKIARGKNIIIIEDALAIGAAYRGKKIGAHCPLVNFWFYASKIFRQRKADGDDER